MRALVVLPGAVTVWAWPGTAPRTPVALRDSRVRSPVGETSNTSSTSCVSGLAGVQLRRAVGAPSSSVAAVTGAAAKRAMKPGSDVGGTDEGTGEVPIGVLDMTEAAMESRPSSSLRGESGRGPEAAPAATNEPSAPICSVASAVPTGGQVDDVCRTHAPGGYWYLVDGTATVGSRVQYTTGGSLKGAPFSTWSRRAIWASNLSASAAGSAAGAVCPPMVR